MPRYFLGKLRNCKIKMIHAAKFLWDKGHIYIFLSSLNIEYDTFESLYNGIRNQEVVYGILNSDIAAYQQLTFNEGGIDRKNMLAIVDLIPIPMAITLFGNGSYPDAYDRCLKGLLMKEFEEKAIKYRRKIQVFNDLACQNAKNDSMD